MPDVRGEELGNCSDRNCGVLLDDQGLDHNQQTKGGNHFCEGRTPTSRDCSENDLLEEKSNQCGDDDAGDAGRPERPAKALLTCDLPDVTASHGEGALGEVDDSRSSIDKDDALSEQRISRSSSEAENDVLQETIHACPP